MAAKTPTASQTVLATAGQGPERKSPSMRFMERLQPGNESGCVVAKRDEYSLDPHKAFGFGLKGRVRRLYTVTHHNTKSGVPTVTESPVLHSNPAHAAGKEKRATPGSPSGAPLEMTHLSLPTIGGRGKPKSAGSAARSTAPTATDSSTIVPQPGISEDKYNSYKEAFLSVDDDKSGELSWQEAQQLGSILGMPINRTTFKRMDRDRSGLVDFEEMLRIVFPDVPKREIQAAIKLWGMPGEVRGEDGPTEEEIKASTHWTARMQPWIVKELKSIFFLYHGSLEGKLTKADFRSRASRSGAIFDGILDEVFALHADADGITLDQFAEVMQDTYANVNDDIKATQRVVKLHFQHLQ